METEEERRIRRRKRIEEMKRKKRQVEFMRRWGIVVSAAVLAAAGIRIGVALLSDRDGSREANQGGDTVAVRDVEADESIEAMNSGGSTAGYGSDDIPAGGERGNPETAVRRKGNRMANMPVNLPEDTEMVPVSGPGEEMPAEAEGPEGMLFPIE